MPPVRSNRTRSSTSVVSDVSSTSQNDFATVPPFKDSKSRIEWACNLRGIDPSSFITKGTSSGKRRSRHWCRLCHESVEGDQKTVDRHTDSNGHLDAIAKELRVDPKSLRAPPMFCQYCKKGIAGARKDSLKRHEGGCRNNPARRGLGSMRSHSMNDLDHTTQKPVTKRSLGRTTSMPASLPSHSSTAPRDPSATGSEPPTTSDNVRAVTTAQPSSVAAPSTTLFYGLSAPHATLPPAPLDTDMFLSALRQPVLTIRHTEYGLLPPPFFGSDPLFCLGPTAAGFDSDLETLSGGPPGWDWLIDSWA